MWGCSSGESRNRGRPQVSRTVIARDQQRAHMAPSGAWTAPGGSRWRPGRLPVASGTLPGMDLGPKFVPKLRVLWFFGPERSQICAKTTGFMVFWSRAASRASAVRRNSRGLRGRPQKGIWGPKREFGVGTDFQK